MLLAKELTGFLTRVMMFSSAITPVSLLEQRWLWTPMTIVLPLDLSRTVDSTMAPRLHAPFVIDYKGMVEQT